MLLSSSRIGVTAVVIGLGAAVGPAPAALIDNSTVSILNTSSAAYPGYPQSDSIDLGPNQYDTDYASASLGTATHLDFQFPVPETFSSVQETDRTTSGGGNGGFVGGTGDFVTSYELIFATDSAFTNVVDTITVNRTTPTPPTSVASFQTTSSVPDVTAQYVRWQVVAANGVNPGAADFEFDTVPEPASLCILALGGLCFLRRDRRA